VTIVLVILCTDLLPSRVYCDNVIFLLQLGCCGAFGFSDYQSNNFTRVVPGAIVPVSCCALKDGPGHIPVSTSQFVNFEGCQHSSPAPDSFNNQVNTCFKIVYYKLRFECSTVRFLCLEFSERGPLWCIIHAIFTTNL
jgi:hypothetical protein